MGVMHELKTDRSSFQRLVEGTKTFEVREDGGYQTGDSLRLREYDLTRCPYSHLPLFRTARNDVCQGRDRCRAYTGRELWYRVGFIFKAGYGLDLGEHVVILLPHPDSVPSMNPHTDDGGPIEELEEVS